MKKEQIYKEIMEDPNVHPLAKRYVTSIRLHEAMSKYETRDRCPFWTTNYLATGYCRFNNEECHASKACLHMDRSVKCNTHKSLMKLSENLKLSLDTFLLFPKGENAR